ncbi:MAG: hypothetical protein ABI340_08460 [Nitrososphaera sp.]
MHDHKLLSISGMINEDGKKYFLYKSKVKGIISCFSNGKIQVKIIPNTTMTAA